MDTKTSPRSATARRAPSLETAPRDQALFARLGATWRTPEDSSWRTLAAMNEARLGFIYREVARTFPADKNKPKTTPDFTGLRVLDLGCGGGLTAFPCAATGMFVRAVDGDLETIRAAQEQQKRMQKRKQGQALDGRGAGTADTITGTLKGKVQFIHGDLASELQEAKQKPRQYDLVLCLEVLEHLNTPDTFVQELCSLVAEGGLLIISTLNRTARSFVAAIAVAERIARLVPQGTHEWQKFVPPETLRLWAKAGGLEPQAIAGLVPSPLGGWHLDGNRLACNYIAAFAKPVRR